MTSRLQLLVVLALAGLGRFELQVFRFHESSLIRCYYGFFP